MWRGWLLSIGCAVAWAVIPGAGVGADTSASRNDFAHTLRTTRWVAYAPTNYNPEVAPPLLPSADSVREDLLVVKRAGFNGLVTYGASLPVVVDMAEAVGFDAVLLGVWDPSSVDEKRQAVRSSANRVVAGLICGNEGLMFRRYSMAILKSAIDELRDATRKPVATTEVIESFYTKPELIAWSDFLAVNAHPFFHGRRAPAEAVEWTLAAWNRLREHVGDKPMLFKEVGLPTRGQGDLSEAAQAEYYAGLLRTDVTFAFFEAFDALFKRGAIEQSWGVFRADRTAKPAARLLAPSPR